MPLNAVDAVRQYVTDASARRVQAISPRTISTRLSCNEAEAISLLERMRSEGRGTFHGFMTCSECQHSMPLEATSLMDLLGEASRHAGHPCVNCGETLGLPDVAPDVHLAFFLVFDRTNDDAPSRPIDLGSYQNSAVSLETMRAAMAKDPFQIVINQPHIGNLGINAPVDTVGLRGAAGASYTSVSTEQSSAQTSATGQERKRVVKRSGWLSSWLSHREEEYERSGTYVDGDARTRTSSKHVSVWAIVVVAALVAVAVLLSVWSSRA